MKMKNIIKKQQKTIFIGFMSVALFIICICTVCTAYAADKDNAKTPVDIPGLTYDHSMELSYAEEFSVDYYNDGYALITIDQEGQFLVVPEGKKAPEGLDPDIAGTQSRSQEKLTQGSAGNCLPDFPFFFSLSFFISHNPEIHCRPPC